MHNRLFVLFAFLAVGCASAPKSKFTWQDREARIMIDPTGIPAEHFTMIKDALMKSDRFVVIDRPSDPGSIGREKAKIDPDSQASRWKEWSRKFDVGGVLVAHVQCRKMEADFYCHQYLAVKNADTGELIAVAEGENSTRTEIGY